MMKRTLEHLKISIKLKLILILLPHMKKFYIFLLTIFTANKKKYSQQLSHERRKKWHVQSLDIEKSQILFYFFVIIISMSLVVVVYTNGCKLSALASCFIKNVFSTYLMSMFILESSIGTRANTNM